MSDITAVDRSSRRLTSYVAMLRVHQWSKNLLIMVPIITSHQLTRLDLALKAGLGFVVLCLCTSAQYIINDLVDLEADRRHPIKRGRPFASGDIPLTTGYLVAPVLLVASLAGAWFLSKWFAAALGIYFAVSLSYSISFKKVVILDACILASLYTLRIFMGDLVTEIPFSVWLLSFAFFLFLSLAFCKRWAELDRLRSTSGGMVRRGYRIEDAGQVNIFGVSSAFLSAVIFILYLQSDNVRALYNQPQLLWLLTPIFVYWIARLWIRSSRGEVDEDPVLFVLKDGVTYVVAALWGLVMLAAAIWPRS